MAIFTNNHFIDDTQIVACEGYDFELGGNYDAIMESYEDDYAIIEAMYAFDMEDLKLTKESADFTQPQPVLEASLKEIWEKIKAFIVNLGKKIAAFFKSVADFISSIVMSGSEFAKKYKERLGKVKLSNFTYDMYEYKISSNFKTGRDFIKNGEASATETVKLINAIKVSEANANAKLENVKNNIAKENEENLADLRKKLSGEADSEKFTEALFNKFRNGGSKKRVNVSSVNDYVVALEKSDDLLKNIKEMDKNVKETFKKMEQIINEAAREAEKESGDAIKAQIGARKAGLMRAQVSHVSKVQSIITRYINAWSSAVKESTGVYKNLCFKAMQHKPAK